MAQIINQQTNLEWNAGHLMWGPSFYCTIRLYFYLSCKFHSKSVSHCFEMHFLIWEKLNHFSSFFLWLRSKLSKRATKIYYLQLVFIIFSIMKKTFDSVVTWIHLYTYFLHSQEFCSVSCLLRHWDIFEKSLGSSLKILYY